LTHSRIYMQVEHLR